MKAPHRHEALEERIGLVAGLFTRGGCRFRRDELEG